MKILNLAIYLPINQFMCPKEIQYISIMCVHTRQWTPQGWLPCNSLLLICNPSFGAEPMRLPCTHRICFPLLISEIQGELVVFDTQPPPSLISSHYTNVTLAFLSQTSSKFMYIVSMPVITKFSFSSHCTQKIWCRFTTQLYNLSGWC